MNSDKSSVTKCGDEILTVASSHDRWLKPVNLSTVALLELLIVLSLISCAATALQADQTSPPDLSLT